MPQASPRLLLKGGNAFLFSNPSGDITRPREGQGLYWQDTRHLSQYTLSPWPSRFVLDKAEVPEPSRARFTLAVNRPPGPTLRVTRERVLAPPLHETIRVRNPEDIQTSLPLRLAFRADFADTFEVRGMVPPRRRVPHVDLSGRSVLFSRTGEDGVPRWTRLTFDPLPNRLNRSRVVWDLYLPPRSDTVVSAQVETGTGSPPRERALAPFRAVAERVRRGGSSRLRAWARVKGGSRPLVAWTEQAAQDLLSLLIQVDGFEIPAAGLPWYATLFGRDSLIVGLQTVHVNPSLSQGILRALAARQGRRHDTQREEEPGKILHELNQGELAGAGTTPYGPYYGTVDATPLFLCLLDEVYRWTGDLAFVRELFPAADRAARHIIGQLQGPLGFLSYRGGERPALRHQGWKDGEVGILRPDGGQPKPPVAPCEAQGYAHWALRGFVEIAGAVDEDAQAADSEAAKLKGRFHKAFWMPDEDTYAIALEARGRKVSLVSSNPGHLLMCGILDAPQAEWVARRLFAEDLHSGRGIRTLSEKASYYDPMSYHHGSVWPHDNSLIAFGLARSGHQAKTALLFEELATAAQAFTNRLPELFGGQSHSQAEPVRIRRACDLQAWAAGVPFLLIRSLLGLEADTSHGTLRVSPFAPEGLSKARIGPLQIGKTRVMVTVDGEGPEAVATTRFLEGPKLEILT